MEGNGLMRKVEYKAEKIIDSGGILHIVRKGNFYSLDVAHTKEAQIVDPRITTANVNMIFNELIGDLVAADARVANMEFYISQLVKEGIVDPDKFNEFMSMPPCYNNKSTDLKTK
jgi:hypothetical protein